jgi:MoxR-like ATPase
MKVVSSGVAQFIDPEELPDRLVQGGTFRSRYFKGHDEGTILTCRFSVGKNTRHLLHVSDEVQHEEAEQLEPGATDYGEWVGEYFIVNDLLTVIQTGDALAQKYGAAIITVNGESGYGKTRLADVIAEYTGRDFCKVPCQLIRDPEEFFGTREAREGDTVFVQSNYIKAIGAGRHVILLDEATRMEGWIANGVLSLLDDSRSATVLNETFNVGENTLWVLTMNEGGQYTGTFDMDEALRNRADIHYTVGPLPPIVEAELVRRLGISADDANSLVSIMEALRNAEISIDVTTRTSRGIAKLMSVGRSLQEAIDMTIISTARTKSKDILDTVQAVLRTGFNKQETLHVVSAPDKRIEAIKAVL